MILLSFQRKPAVLSRVTHVLALHGLMLLLQPDALLCLAISVRERSSSDPFNNCASAMFIN